MAAPDDRASFSIPSVLAAICAALSFFSTGFAFVFAVAAIILGLVGALLAASPARRGGIMSIFAVLLGIIAAIVSILRFVIGLLT